MSIQVLTVLGSTGSIGVNTLDVVARHPDRFRIFALAGHKQTAKLARQCIQFRSDFAVVADESAAADLKAILTEEGCTTEVLYGRQALIDVASAGEVDGVMCAIVGAAGLPSRPRKKAKPFIWPTKKLWWWPANYSWKLPVPTGQGFCR